jgi:hypothetical protein
MELRTCSGCGGLAPAARTSCVHCDRPLRGLARAVAAIVGGGALMMTLAACYGVPPKCDPADDKDGDGFCPKGRRVDCDDSQKDVHPGATDTPGDGIDQDCSGADAPPP